MPPDGAGSFVDTLMRDEYAELALYVDLKKDLYTPYVFRPYLSAARLRACIPEIEARKDADEGAWRALIAGFDGERHVRRENAKNTFEQRAAGTATLGRG